MPSEPLIVVVDDDGHIRQAVQRALISGGYRVRTFDSAGAYLAEMEAVEAECLVFDIKLPDSDGLTMLREVRAAGIETPAIFITGTNNLRAAVDAMKLGAVDLLEKPLDVDTLLAAVAKALRRGEAQHVERRHLAELWMALERLTPREAQVGALVTSGRLNKQIAMLIGTTEKTVKVHRARAMAKLEVHSVAELVRTVDILLDEHAPASIVIEGHRVVTRPPVLDMMAKALGRRGGGANGGNGADGAEVTPPSQSTRERSTGSSGSVDLPRSM